MSHILYTGLASLVCVWIHSFGRCSSLARNSLSFFVCRFCSFAQFFSLDISVVIFPPISLLQPLHLYSDSLIITSNKLYSHALIVCDILAFFYTDNDSVSWNIRASFALDSFRYPFPYQVIWCVISILSFSLYVFMTMYVGESMWAKAAYVDMFSVVFDSTYTQIWTNYILALNIFTIRFSYGI